jgi:hypothetical protein
MASSSSTKAGKRTKKENVSPSSKSSLVLHSRSLDRQTLGLCLMLIVIVCAFYSPIVHNGFLNYDDKQYITDNPPVKAGLTWKTVEWAFTTDTEANWHPLTWLSHALDCDLFGLSPVGPHSVNVLLHAANAVLLFLLLQSATGFRWRQYAHAMALQPTDVGYLLLAHALQLEGHADEASAALERATRLSRNLPQAQMQAESLLAGK